jgi:ABC-2 type transport system permease protein/lipopolysaccharide transport system permease protein
MTVLERPKQSSTTAIDRAPPPQTGMPAESFLAFVARMSAELRHIKFALASFIINNLRRRYRRSVLGFAWSLLNPLLTMIVLTLVFSLLFKSSPRDFAMHLFTGLLPWMFVSDSITNGSLSIVTSEAFLKKVYIPKMFFPLVSVGTEAVNFGLSMVSMIILGFCLGMHIGSTILLAPLAILLLFGFSYSVSLLLAIGTVYFRDLTHIVKICLSAAFYLVPIIYPLAQIPEPYRKYFLLNPMYYFINLFRLTINDCRIPTLLDWAIPTASMLIVFTMAMYTLMKTEKDLIYRL